MQSSLASLEAKLNEMLVTKAPFQIPDGARKWIATYAWVFTVIGVVLGVIAAIGLLGLLGIASVAIGGALAATGNGSYLFFAWLALAVLVLQVILEAMAISPLKNMQKRGWDLIFYSVLISIAYNLLNAFQGSINAASAFIGFLWSLFISLVVLYVLFQVRGQFKGARSEGENSSAAPKV